jgi:hypothetical protein
MPTICSRFSVIIDEFDSIASEETRKSIAETVKHLADKEINAKIIIVGVSESVADLVAGHQSVGRCLKEIEMPRMSEAEIEQFFTKGFKACEFVLSDKTLKKIKMVSCGLPFFAHKIGLNIGRIALERDSLSIEDQDIIPAFERALEDSAQTIKVAVDEATHSRHPDNYYKEALLACALIPARTKEFFTAAEIKKPFSAIMKKDLGIPNYIRHIQEFCKPKRGPVLTVVGDMHDRRYKFKNPSFQPNILMDGIVKKMIDFKLLEKFFEG